MPTDTLNANADMTFSKQLSDILRAQISRGDFKPGARIPSERELCEIYGVSRTTVRTAVMSLVFDGLLVRHAGDGTYVHRKPESKVNGSTTKGTVAFVRCQHSDGLHQLVSDYIYSDILLGVQQTVDNEKQHVIFSYLSEVAPDVIGRVEAITKKVDGLIICEIRNKETYDKLMSLRIPIVLVNPNIHSYKSDSVDVDNVNGAYEAVEHLIHLGHQNIGIIRGRLPTSHALGRLEGYYKALDDNGIPRRDAFVVGGADWQKSSGYEAMKELLSAIPRPTAVFASSDPLAAGALQAIKEGSLNVPGDISVVGFDDMIISQHTFPALTTMQIPRGQMGRHAALRLLDLVNNPSQPMQKVVFSPILVERESTSPPRKQ